MQKIKILNLLFFIFSLLFKVELANGQRGERGERSNYRTISPFKRLIYRGYPYYFSNGLYYENYGGYYRNIFPPLGISLRILPSGYWPFTYGGFPYYYQSGIYYRQNENEYEVVEAPLGASVPNLPKDAKLVEVNGEKYYEFNGTYYKNILKSDSKYFYTIVGVHGNLNTDLAINITKNKLSNEIQLKEDSSKKSKIGDTIEMLPNGSKSVIINNHKYFVSTNNLYFEEFIENNILKYRLVGE
jgi:hypothetical protein